MNTPTPAEAKWLAAQGPSSSRDFHPMSYNAIKLTISNAWASRGEEAVMKRLLAILRAPDNKMDGPFGPRETGYRWQLDISNDWWAELATVTDTGNAVLTIAYRYNGTDNRVRKLAEWAAVVFEGKVVHPPVHGFVLARKGGEWLGAARRWMQSRFNNGSDVAWGSENVLHGGSLRVRDVEELASMVAAATLEERNQGRL